MRARFRSRDRLSLLVVGVSIRCHSGTLSKRNLDELGPNRLGFNPLSCGHAFEAQRGSGHRLRQVSIRCHAGTLSKPQRQTTRGCGRFQSAVMRARFRSANMWSNVRLWVSIRCHAGTLSKPRLMRRTRPCPSFNPLSCGHAFEAWVKYGGGQPRVSIRCHAGTLSKPPAAPKPRVVEFQSAVMRARFRSPIPDLPFQCWCVSIRCHAGTLSKRTN